MSAITSFGDVRDRKQLRYTDVAIAFHWAIAALIVYNLTSGLLKPALPRAFFIFHVSSGITILVLSVARVIWRLTHRPPAFLPMASWERQLAHAVHVLLYVAMLALPLSGWALVSAHPPAGSPGAAWAAQHAAADSSAGEARKGTSAPGSAASSEGQEKAALRKRGPILIWGLFKLPLIAPLQELGREPDGIPHQKAVHENIEDAHLFGGWIMLALLVLHVTGALKHQLVDRRRELARMGLGRPVPVSPVSSQGTAA